MTQFLAAIAFIFKMLPLIKSTVQSLQEHFPGNGTAKLEVLTAVLDQAASADTELQTLYTAAKPKLSPILNALVALIKGKPAVPAAT